MASLGLSKVFILDKYFTELQKFWETEKKLQGKCRHLITFLCSYNTIKNLIKSINLLSY